MAKKDPLKAALQLAVAQSQPTYDELMAKDPAAGWSDGDLATVVEHNRRQRALWRYAQAQKAERAATAAGANPDEDAEGEED